MQLASFMVKVFESLPGDNRRLQAPCDFSLSLLLRCCFLSLFRSPRCTGLLVRYEMKWISSPQSQLGPSTKLRLLLFPPPPPKHLMRRNGQPSTPPSRMRPLLHDSPPNLVQNQYGPPNSPRPPLVQSISYNFSRRLFSDPLKHNLN